jgi:sugar (pentulose or hexulose) kinase
VEGFAVVLDVGKTHTKASLWSPQGALVAGRQRLNARTQGPGYQALDVAGIEAFLEESLRAFGQQAAVGAIVPVAHGAAMAVLREGRLLLPPMDYEQALPEEQRAAYAVERDAFALTGSPALPAGLNLGAQLHLLQAQHPDAFAAGTTLLPWPQYWAWVLCGVAANEVTSMGSHTDLWYPARGTPSRLAQRRGWAARFAPLRHAAQQLGCLSADWVQRTGLPATTTVHCGLHDSNAALLASRGHAQIGARETTVLSTGTWFVGMRSTSTAVDLAALDAQRDCLVNVDVDGRLVPSARFMGGREIEILTGDALRRIDDPGDQTQLLDAVPRVLERGTCVLPTFAPGCGPFPHAHGRWVHRPTDAVEVRAAIGLYAALVADAALRLVGACGQMLVEGRFATCEVFVRALAALRPDASLYTLQGENAVARGALRLLDPLLEPASAITRVLPLDCNLEPLRDAWVVAANTPGSHL